MNRGTMRDVLARRLNDPGDGTGFWEVPQLDQLLDLGAARVIGRLQAGDPERSLFRTHQNLTASNRYYPKPIGIEAILDVRMLDSETGEYRSLGDPVDLVDLDSKFPSVVRYALFGNAIKLSAAPEADVTDGLEWWGTRVPTIESGEENDGQSYDVPLRFHNAVIYEAQLISIPESVEEAEGKELRELLAAEYADMATNRRVVGREIPLQIPSISKRGAR